MALTEYAQFEKIDLLKLKKGGHLCLNQKNHQLFFLKNIIINIS